MIRRNGFRRLGVSRTRQPLPPTAEELAAQRRDAQARIDRANATLARLGRGAKTPETAAIFDSAVNSLVTAQADLQAIDDMMARS